MKPRLRLFKLYSPFYYKRERFELGGSVSGFILVGGKWIIKFAIAMVSCFKLRFVRSDKKGISLIN